MLVAAHADHVYHQLEAQRAKSETVKTNGMFKAVYQSRRALMPIDGFFEWKDISGTGKNKQPYAIAMKSGEPLPWPRSGRIGATPLPATTSHLHAADL